MYQHQFELTVQKLRSHLEGGKMRVSSAFGMGRSRRRPADHDTPTASPFWGKIPLFGLNSWVEGRPLSDTLAMRWGRGGKTRFPWQREELIPTKTHEIWEQPPAGVVLSVQTNPAHQQQVTDEWRRLQLIINIFIVPYQPLVLGGAIGSVSMMVSRSLQPRSILIVGARLMCRGIRSSKPSHLEHLHLIHHSGLALFRYYLHLNREVGCRLCVLWRRLSAKGSSSTFTKHWDSLWRVAAEPRTPEEKSHLISAESGAGRGTGTQQLRVLTRQQRETFLCKHISIQGLCRINRDFFNTPNYSVVLQLNSKCCIEKGNLPL